MGDNCDASGHTRDATRPPRVSLRTARVADTHAAVSCWWSAAVDAACRCGGEFLREVQPWRCARGPFSLSKVVDRIKANSEKVRGSNDYSLF